MDLVNHPWVRMPHPALSLDPLSKNARNICAFPSYYKTLVSWDDFSSFLLSPLEAILAKILNKVWLRRPSLPPLACGDTAWDLGPVEALRGRTLYLRHLLLLLRALAHTQLQSPPRMPLSKSPRNRTERLWQRQEDSIPLHFTFMNILLPPSPSLPLRFACVVRRGWCHTLSF